ncbi:MAG: calcium/proton exchanger [Gemmatimonadetes bacterium]|nr:calcium/proton exchanger [Gemmatimonadota bacterium]
MRRYWRWGLLLLAPVALVLEYAVHAPPLVVFVVSSLAVVPLAALMGRATEQLAEQLGEGPGGLLNATFGNAAELIIAILALRAGLYDLVKASITGSIIGNILLVFGAGALYGGLKYRSQRFNATAASLGATMLVVSAIGLLVPAVFHRLAGAGGAPVEQGLSTEIAVVLLVTYALSLLFTLKTHKHLYVGDAGPHALELAGAAVGSTGRALLLLLGASVGVALMSELLVGAVDEAAEAAGMSEVFVGVILVALIGNAAEHSTAILMAGKNKMDAAINIAVGSSIQIALFVAPALVLLSYFVGPRPMDLIFTTFEVAAVTLAVMIMAFIALDGESHWMEGVQLLAVYLILGIAFFFLPV